MLKNYKEIKMDRNAGFTMLEMIITLALIGIIAAVVVPNFIGWLPDLRLRSACQNLYLDLQKARFEAVKRNNWCAVIFSKTGYHIYVDADQDFERDGDETIIVQTDWASFEGVKAATYTIDDSGPSGQPCLAFRANGIPAVKSGIANGRATLTNTNGKLIDVIISQAGNIRIE